MSDLKYKTVPELIEAKNQCENRISELKSQLSGQNVRLEWINKYIFEKTPKEMTIEHIERKLGHKVIIK